MELVSVIRHKVLTEGVPIRDVARQLGLSRNTIRRYVRAKVVPVPRPASPSRATPAKELVAEAAATIWASRRSFTAGKQRLTATRLWELLRDDGLGCPALDRAGRVRGGPGQQEGEGRGLTRPVTVVGGPDPR